jgi:hypothetical protein
MGPGRHTALCCSEGSAFVGMMCSLAWAVRSACRYACRRCQGLRCSSPRMQLRMEHTRVCIRKG